MRTHSKITKINNENWKLIQNMNTYYKTYLQSYLTNYVQVHLGTQIMMLFLTASSFYSIFT